jgi:hypothetical protein
LLILLAIILMIAMAVVAFLIFLLTWTSAQGRQQAVDADLQSSIPGLTKWDLMKIGQSAHPTYYLDPNGDIRLRKGDGLFFKR